MNRTMITATNTMGQLQHKMNIISQNMANVGTDGYKRKESYFNDLLVQQLNNQRNAGQEIGRLTPNGIRVGNGAKVSQSQFVLTQGAIKTTGRELDLALTKSDLFFSVLVDDGKEQNIRYTRNGSFHLSPVAGTADGMMLTNGNGNPVLDEFNAPIIINGGIESFQFNEKGQLSVQTNTNGTQTFDLGIVSVQKPQFLQQLSDTLVGLPANFAELGVNEEDILTAMTGGLRQEVSMQSRALENSNVDLSKEMTDLINMQRQYQFSSRSVTMADQMLGLINGIR